MKIFTDSVSATVDRAALEGAARDANLHYEGETQGSETIFRISSNARPRARVYRRHINVDRRTAAISWGSALALSIKTGPVQTFATIEWRGHLAHFALLMFSCAFAGAIIYEQRIGRLANNSAAAWAVIVFLGILMFVLPLGRIAWWYSLCFRDLHVLRQFWVQTRQTLLHMRDTQ